jgi:DNA transformation protein and related proteins
MDLAEIEELFSGLGPVSVRRMFGGKGVYHQGLIVAVELRGEMLLKGDALTAPELEAAGARRWTHTREGRKPVQMPYWSIPDSAYDDPDEMARWTRLAFAAALRAQR